MLLIRRPKSPIFGIGSLEAARVGLNPHLLFLTSFCAPLLESLVETDLGNPPPYP